MPLAVETTAARTEADLPQRVAAAIQDKAAPISTLLRLYWALDAVRDPANQNGALREQLRLRIGGPFPN